MAAIDILSSGYIAVLHAVHGSLSSTPPCEDRQVLCLAVLPGWHIDPMPVAPWACNVLKLVPIHTKQPLRCCRHQNRGCWASGQDACMMQAQLYSSKYFSVLFSTIFSTAAASCQKVLDESCKVAGNTASCEACSRPNKGRQEQQEY